MYSKKSVKSQRRKSVPRVVSHPESEATTPSQTIRQTHPAQSLTHNQILSLQRTIGNRAVQRILKTPNAQASNYVQRQFSIKNGKTYTSRNQLTKSYVMKIIREATLPRNVSANDVYEVVEQWADMTDDFGTFSWADLIDFILQEAFPSDMETDVNTLFAPYSPTYTQGTPPSTPMNDESWKFERRLSGDFSDLFQSTFGEKTEDVRSMKMQLENKETGEYGKTYGPGRFMSMTGEKVLGHTRYTEFLPDLPALTGLTTTEVAQGILNGLLDDNQFQVLLGTLDNKGATAMQQTVLLLHNEIIHRSSTNLISIVGALVRSVSEPSKDFDDRFMQEGKFIPTKKTSGVGGQQLSRMHHDEWQTKLEPKLNDDLKELWRSNKKAIASVMSSHNLDFDTLADTLKDGLIGKYIENLKSHWNVTFY